MSRGEIQICFDYDVLDPVTRDEVRQESAEIKKSVRRAREDVVSIGMRLIKVKAILRAKLGHGHFGSWLQAEFQWSVTTAWGFMQIAKAFKSSIIEDLAITPTALQTLASPSVPEEARQEAISAASNGQHIGTKEAKAIVQKHKELEAETAPIVPLPGQSTFFDDESGDEEQESESIPEEEDVGSGVGMSDVEEPFGLHTGTIPNTSTAHKPKAGSSPPTVSSSKSGAKPLVNLGNGPTYPRVPGVRSAACFERWVDHLNNIIINVREHDGIAGSVEGLTATEKSYLFNHFVRFRQHLDSWIQFLEENR